SLAGEAFLVLDRRERSNGRTPDTALSCEENEVDGRRDPLRSSSSRLACGRCRRRRHRCRASWLLISGLERGQDAARKVRVGILGTACPMQLECAPGLLDAPDHRPRVFELSSSLCELHIVVPRPSY